MSHPRAIPILQGTRGVVLGVSSENGVGYRCAATFRELGAEVGVTFRPPSRENGARRASELGCAHAELEATDEASIARAFETLGRELGKFDFLVHTLVHVPPGVLDRPLCEVSARDFAAVLEVGVRSFLASCRYALPFLSRSSHPRVVALLSPGAEAAIPRYHVVGIAKSALAAAVRYLAAELGPAGVLCNALGFSILETDAARRVVGDEAMSKTRSHLVKRSMTRTALEFDDVTHALAFLASPLCRNMTGETLTVDGGFSRSYFR
jgi:enoyl-[acyl-carrier protein] reductase I